MISLTNLCCRKHAQNRSEARKAAYAKLGRAMQDRNGIARPSLPPDVLSRWTYEKTDEKKKFAFLCEYMLDPSWGTMTVRLQLIFQSVGTRFKPLVTKARFMFLHAATCTTCNAGAASQP